MQVDSYQLRGTGRVEAGTLVRGVLGHVNLDGHGVADRHGARFAVGDHADAGGPTTGNVLHGGAGRVAKVLGDRRHVDAVTLGAQPLLAWRAGLVGLPVDGWTGGPTRRGHVGGGRQVGERENLVQFGDHEQPAKEGAVPDDHHPTTGGLDLLVGGEEGVESGRPHEADTAQLDAQIGGALTDKVGDDRADGVGVDQVELAVQVDLRPRTDPGHVDHG